MLIDAARSRQRQRIFDIAERSDQSQGKSRYMFDPGL